MKIATLVLIVLTSGLLCAQETSELATPPNGDAERAEVSQWIGPVRISIEYHSPRVHNPATNDRTGYIWGELVHYGFVDEGFGPSQYAVASRRQRDYDHHAVGRREVAEKT